MVSPGKSKRKIDTMRNPSPLEHAAADGRPQNVEMEDAANQSKRPSFGATSNIFAANQPLARTQAPMKKLVSIDTLLRHPGCKEELYNLLTIQGKRLPT